VSYLLTWLGTLNLVDVGAILVFLVFWVWILRRQRDRLDTYDLSDNIKDPWTNKASGTSLVYLSLAGLAAWWAIRSASTGGDPSNFIVTVLGIFVAKGGVDRAVNAWGSRQPDKAPEPVREDPPIVELPAPSVAVSVSAPAEIKTTTTVSEKAGG
jgi:hypothetical protein